MLQAITKSPAETMELGKVIGRNLKDGAMVLLDGELGAGKTCLVSGIVKGLGMHAMVTSPTFSLVNQYVVGNLCVLHMDMYRCKTLYDLESTGFFDFWQEGSMFFLIEWYSNIEKFLPSGGMKIGISVVAESERLLTIQNEEVLIGWPAGPGATFPAAGDS
ncbi:MAG: tRNA (adenosine(37)-N6)-threonylcarbamoyltransferase complex ATPase subunit type 1 TsaE [Oscillospiraceae bacterium]|jgi:tRNA threonylcarbamoyladenosine biosynthesis protein TsaE|nr:tRNA (adenosine(37)-N6)-threonylcarbamoyltransferase complex ATPase subunit type 1 TsaE [Oscillospiraceae bacterium]